MAKEKELTFSKVLAINKKKHMRLKIRDVNRYYKELFIIIWIYEFHLCNVYDI